MAGAAKVAWELSGSLARQSDLKELETELEGDLTKLVSQLAVNMSAQVNDLSGSIQEHIKHPHGPFFLGSSDIISNGGYVSGSGRMPFSASFEVPSFGYNKMLSTESGEMPLIDGQGPLMIMIKMPWPESVKVPSFRGAGIPSVESGGIPLLKNNGESERETPS